MSSRILASLFVLFLSGVAATSVDGQEDPAGGGSGPIAAGREPAASERGPTQSILVSGPQAAARRREAGESSSLVDRLKRLRDAAGEGERLEPGTLPNGAGVTSGAVAGVSAVAEGPRLAQIPTPPPDSEEESTTEPREGDAPRLVDPPKAGALNPAAPATSPRNTGSARRTAVEPTGPELNSSTPGSARRALIEPRPRGSSAAAPVGRGLLLASQAPVLRVETNGPDAIAIGKAADFTVSLVNDGGAAAEGVHVRVLIPSSVEVLEAVTEAGPVKPQDDGSGQQKIQWSELSIPAKGRAQLDLKLKPTDNQPFDLAVDWTLRPTAAVAQIRVQQPQLAVALLGPKDLLYGTSAVYTIQLTNPGTGDAEDVTLEFVYGQRHLAPKQVGTLAAGQQTEIDVELTAEEAGQLRISAVATGAGGLKAEAVEEMLVRRGRLEVEVVGPPVEFAGTAASYRVRVANVGDAAASEVVTTVLLPRGAKALAAAESSVQSEASLTWEIGTLSPGAERVMEFKCELTAAGENRVEARAQASGDLDVLQAFVTHVKALADLKLLVNDPQGPTAVGDFATYEVRIVNRGTSAAEQVQALAQFSDGIEPVEAHGGAASVVPGQVLFQPIERIEAGAEVLLKVVARAERDGIHRFRVEVRCAEPDTRLVAEESTYFFDGKTIRGGQP